MKTAQQAPKIAPILAERIDRLAGCQGRWLLIRDGEPEADCSHQWHQGPEEHLATCLAERWRGISLGFVSSYCGFSDYSTTGLVGLANYNVLIDPQTTPDPHCGILEIGYGWNGRGIVLDVLRVSEDVLESVESLESYPLLSEEEHSNLEMQGIEKLWADESINERVTMLQDLDLCIFAARRDSAPWEFDKLRDSLTATLNEYSTLVS
jgi:hypothetical protein